MRRPFNWGFASLALIAPLASWDPPRDALALPPTVLPDVNVPGGGTLGRKPGKPGQSPFAYVREDGSEVFLPIEESARSLEEMHADSGFQQWTKAQPDTAEVADLEAAVYTWSSPVAAERPSYQ